MKWKGGTPFSPNITPALQGPMIPMWNLSRAPTITKSTHLCIQHGHSGNEMPRVFEAIRLTASSSCPESNPLCRRLAEIRSSCELGFVLDPISPYDPGVGPSQQQDSQPFPSPHNSPHISTDEGPSSENMAIACFVDYLTLMPTYGFLFLII